MEKQENRKTGKQRKKKTGKNTRGKRKYTQEDLARMVIKAMTTERNRRGLNDTKIEVWEKKHRKNRDNYNATNEVKTVTTKGGWNTKRICSTRSKWAMEHGTQSIGTENTQFGIENMKPVETYETVILYEKETGKAKSYNGEIVQYTGKENAKWYVKIPVKQSKIIVEVHENTNEVENEELLRIALRNKIRVLIIDKVITK